MTVPGWVCPFCGTDCSPIEGPPCAHYFLTDGENGWRFSAEAEAAFLAAERRSPTLFRELVYHNASCREHLVLRRAVYESSLEVYVFSEHPTATQKAFIEAIG